MNCLSHAWKYLDQPHFAAGTCIPDWLGMVDRSVRVRRKAVEAFLAKPITCDANDSHRDVVAGIRQHLVDDDLFHGSFTFQRLSLELAKGLLPWLDDSQGHRRGFVAHVMIELLLDAAIETRHPNTIDRYYASLEQVSPAVLESSINSLASKPFSQMEAFIEKYLSVRFLYDYMEDSRLLLRINGVLKRVKLEPLPAAVLPWMAQARIRVLENAIPLLDFE